MVEGYLLVEKRTGGGYFLIHTTTFVLLQTMFQNPQRHTCSLKSSKATSS